MSEVNLVKVDIRSVWDSIKDSIGFIKGESYEAETLEDIYYACVNNEAAIWVDKNIEPKDGFLITKVQRNEFTSERYLLLWIAWYKEETGADKFQKEIEELAKRLHCTSIEFWTSKKEIRDHGITHGYDKITYKCRKEI